ncbi:MAG: putative Ig domain-containing protein, partial [Thermoplasmata archaeon]|nr:putative Ig domain-containing protein [Thermoplasmata archaeon]
EGKAIFDAPDSVHASYLQVLQDPFGGTVVAWMDTRSVFYDIFVQRMNEDGDLLWAEDGMAVSNASLQQDLHCMVMDDEGSLFFLWSDNRDDHPKRDIYAQRLGLYLKPYDMPIKVYEDQVFYDEMHSNDDVNCTWSIITDADWLSIDSETGIMTGVPDNYDVGWVHATVIATDHWARTVRDIDFEVVNIKPSLLSDPPLTAYEDTPYSADLGSTEDGEGGMLWTMETSVDWLTIDPVNGTLNGTPTEDDIGSILLNINIDDGNPGGVSSYYFQMDILGTNDDPMITTISLPDAVEDKLYMYNLEATDPDEIATFLWDLDTDCDWLDLDRYTGTLSGLPRNDDVGSWWMNITVHDGNIGSDNINLSLEVLDVNDPPLILTDPNVEVLQGEDINLTLAGSDDESASLTWNWTDAPSWMSLNVTSGLISGVPTQEDVGTVQITITVDDGNNGNASILLYITVLDVNEAPKITAAPIPNGTEGVPFAFLMSASDPDADGLTWAIVEGPDWLKIDTATGLLTGTPIASGTHQVIITATDPWGLNDTITVTFQIEDYISPADDDDPPADDDDDTPADDDVTVKGSNDDDDSIFYTIIAVLLLLVVILLFILLLNKKRPEEEEKWGEE